MARRRDRVADVPPPEARRMADLIVASGTGITGRTPVAVAMVLAAFLAFLWACAEAIGWLHGL